MPQFLQDADRAFALCMMRRREGDGNAQVNADIFAHGPAEEAAAEEEDFYSEASWDSTSLGLASLIDSGLDDSGAEEEEEEEALAETDFGLAPEDMPMPSPRFAAD